MPRARAGVPAPLRPACAFPNVGPVLRTPRLAPPMKMPFLARKFPCDEKVTSFSGSGILGSVAKNRGSAGHLVAPSRCPSREESRALSSVLGGCGQPRPAVRTAAAPSLQPLHEGLTPLLTLCAHRLGIFQGPAAPSEEGLAAVSGWTELLRPPVSQGRSGVASRPQPWLVPTWVLPVKNVQSSRALGLWPTLRGVGPSSVTAGCVRFSLGLPTSLPTPLSKMRRMLAGASTQEAGRLKPHPPACGSQKPVGTTGGFNEPQLSRGPEPGACFSPDSRHPSGPGRRR